MKKNLGNSIILKELLTYKKFTKNKELAIFLGITPVKIGNWNKRNYADIYLIKEKLPEIDANWLMNPQGPVKVIPKTPEAGIPLISLDSISSFDKSKISEKNYTEMIYVSEFEEIGVEFAITNKGDTMHPNYKGGDKLGCAKVDSKSFRQWNRVYVLDTKQGVIIKRVQKGSKDNTILCVSDNSKYEPFLMPLEDIISISIVLGIISFE